MQLTPLLRPKQKTRVKKSDPLPQINVLQFSVRDNHSPRYLFANSAGTELGGYNEWYDRPAHPIMILTIAG